MRKRGGKKRGEKVEVKEVHTIGVKVMKYMLRATPSHKEREKSRQQQRSLDFSEENDEEEPGQFRPKRGHQISDPVVSVSFWSKPLSWTTCDALWPILAFYSHFVDIFGPRVGF